MERELVGSKTFHRLGRISQLGLASLLFPGATHTRLVHSLGALHIASLIAKRLELPDHEQRIVRTAALLHDIGQYPLSHAIEFLYRARETLRVPEGQCHVWTPPVLQGEK
jgi:HD superfamily phosphohydrolase